MSKPPLKAAAAIFFYAVVLILFAPVRTPFNFYDEGFAVFNATRVVGGEVPYRDFWAIYPPGQLYALAGVYKIFGISLLASRVYVSFTVTISSTLPMNVSVILWTSSCL